MTSARTLLALVAATGGIFGTARWAGAEVPPDLQATIIARLLAYDRALKSRAGSSVGVAVLYNSADRASTEAQAGIVQAFASLRAHTVQGLPLAVAAMPFKDGPDLGAALARDGVDVLYVTPGFGGQLDVIRRACVERKVVCLGPVRAYAEKGLAVAVVPKGDKPHILVNKGATDSLGMDLDPKLLQLAEVLR